MPARFCFGLFALGRLSGTSIEDSKITDSFLSCTVILQMVKKLCEKAVKTIRNC